MRKKKVREWRGREMKPRQRGEGEKLMKKESERSKMTQGK